MSKHKYTLLVVTGFAALSMIGANATMGGWSIPNFNWNLATVGQSSALNNAAKPPFPLVALERSSRGEEAIARLGAKFPEVAQWYKVSEEELKDTLRKDKNLWADKNGRLVYQDTETVTSSNAETAGNVNLSTLGVAPLDQTFTLHSKPGAPKTIYLDFNGHFIKGGTSAWIGSDFNAPAFDTDGNPGVFSDSERQTIQAVWLRVAEDYAPFNLDITTEEPVAGILERSSTSDTIYGNRVLFTPASGSLVPGAGGSSYVGVFDDVGETYKIALVFPEMLGNYDKYMGEAASHESGHSLGLWHDGVTGVTEYYYGQGDWAPTMGVGYYKNIVQWSKGDYASPSNTQDDLQVMISYGLAYSTDDYGNSISSAGNLAVSGNSISGGGLIEKNTDVDYFKFNSGAGQVTIDVGVGFAANLDVVATLYNSAGSVIATSDPYGLPASISATVPGGSYYLSVKGTGAGNPLTDGYSNYGSLGQYSITGTITGTSDNPPVAQVSASPTGGSVPLTVQFSSAGSSDPDGGVLSYSWNFGDNTSSTEQNPQKTYTVTGTYTATLTVQDPTGLSGAKSVTISTVNQAPVAFFTVGTGSYNIPSTVNLDASGSSDSDGTIASYEWTFSDGTTGTGSSVSHVYTVPGTFPIKLTVTDNGGLSSTKTVSITTADPLAINAPTNLSGTTSGKSKNQVSLKWSDTSGNETHFHIERAVRQGTPVYQKIAEVGANVTTHIDNPGAGTYYYRVKAYNGSLNKSSAYSNAIQIRTR